MSLIIEAGIFGPAILLAFVAGLVASLGVGRARGSTMATATPFILGLLSLGQLGQGLGQRLVRDALERVPELVNKVAILNEGTGEAAACHVLSGTAALLLCAIAGVVARTDRRS